jgi:hypothetical protein
MGADLLYYAAEQPLASAEKKWVVMAMTWPDNGGARRVFERYRAEGEAKQAASRMNGAGPIRKVQAAQEKEHAELLKELAKRDALAKAGLRTPGGSGRAAILRAQARALRKDISSLADRHDDHAAARRIKYIAAELSEVETELAALEGK